MQQLRSQLFSLSKGLKRGDFHIGDIGDFIPAALMLHDLGPAGPAGCCYMSRWGCDNLGATADEINRMGPSYYEHFFVKDEYEVILQGMHQYLSTGDFDTQYNFFQRAKLVGKKDYTWFFAVCKVIEVKANDHAEQKAFVLASPIVGRDLLISRVSKILDENTYMKSNFPNYAKLSKREREIIRLIVNGKSTNEISGLLYISPHTVNTHRRNIIHKTGCKRFADLLKFALVFDLQ